MKPSRFLPPLLGTMLLVTSALHAQTPVNPGQSLVLTTVDGGSISVDGAPNSPPYSGTAATPASNNVVAVTRPGGGQANPFASASVYNDIIVTDPDGLGKVVPINFAVNFDYEVAFDASSVHNATCMLTLVIEDITDPASTPVASIGLTMHERSGDQDYTDVTVGNNPIRGLSDVGSATAWLHRGRAYRVSFQATSTTWAPPGGGPPVAAEMDGTMNSLKVTVGEDLSEDLADHDAGIKSALVTQSAEFATLLGNHDSDIKALVTQHDTDIKNQLAQHDTEVKAQVAQHDTDIKAQVAQHDTDIKNQVAQHDTDIKNQLAQHDADIKAQVAQHDADIKAQVSQHDEDIKALLDEARVRQELIIELLLTPQGQRETDNYGSWPLKPEDGNNGNGPPDNVPASGGTPPGQTPPPAPAEPDPVTVEDPPAEVTVPEEPATTTTPARGRWWWLR